MKTNEYQVGDIIKLKAIEFTIVDVPLFTTVTEINGYRVWFVDPEEGRYSFLNYDDANMSLYFRPI